MTGLAVEQECLYLGQRLSSQAAIFGLAAEDEQAATIAEDSNDIYILSGEQHPDQLSPPSSLLCAGDNSSGQSSWQTESLPVSLTNHESWAQVCAMDPEDLKSLGSNEGVALAEERSENNSSNSDIVHVEREDAELMEEGGEGAIEESMMSVLGTESELAELRAEFRDQTPPVPVSSEADSTAPASLISLEEPVVIDTPASLSAEPSLNPEPELPPPVSEAAAPKTSVPEPAAPSPVPAAEPDLEPEPAAASAPVEAAPPSPAKEAVAPVFTPPAEPEIISVSVEELVPRDMLELQPEPETVTKPEVPLAPPPAPEAPVEEPPPQQSPVQMEPEPEPELPLLLYGGALVAFVAAVVYGIMTYRKK
ncbi:hypothetical protein LDENG_00070480 [Lucifuga dentata]|nr:hypothetical protein LDENG_00070480 [Lucifuga dentata]